MPLVIYSRTVVNGHSGQLWKWSLSTYSLCSLTVHSFTVNICVLYAWYGQMLSVCNLLKKILYIYPCQVMCNTIIAVRLD